MVFFIRDFLLNLETYKILNLFANLWLFQYQCCLKKISYWIKFLVAVSFVLSLSLNLTGFVLMKLKGCVPLC